MANYFCEYCGQKFASPVMLLQYACPKHPNGSNRGKHKLYEGGEKPLYTCKYCGRQFTSISQMVSQQVCPKHPNGMNRGRHAPSLA
jgi:DNA-directed RNA polymerase subunit RPC12/RpoP